MLISVFSSPAAGPIPTACIPAAFAASIPASASSTTKQQRGIYQDDLAAAIGYSTKTVGRIERGDSTPSAEFMLRISKYFNMLVEDVFHVEDWAGYFIQLNLPLPVNENLSAPLYKIIPFFRTTNYFSYLNDIDYLINYIIFCLKYP